MNNMTINFGTKTELLNVFITECLKNGLQFSVGTSTATVVAPTKATKPTTAKAPTTGAKKSNKYDVTKDYIFDLSLDSKGYVTLSTETGHSSGAWCIASKTLLENGFTRPEGDKAHYMIAGKNGKVSKTLTKQAYDGYKDHKLVVPAKAINEYNAERYGRA